ncbi:uncharacterized protein LOC141907235 isoform X2 [Tubulanus polymorphus]|uniref:uncharacterized protein LOC141907235 isoform X2 n=1 Tax=Tubulanus polymorphus TaxID=672921 RepID=UPI003DA6C04E
MILDGVFGLRMLEGHLSLILEEQETDKFPKLKDDLISTLEMLHKESSNIAEHTLPGIKENYAKEFNDLGFLISRPWKVWKPQRKLDMSRKWPKVEWDKSHIVMNEKKSDSCMKELLHKRCEPSSNCLELMTSTKYMTDYAITHQVLYSQLAEEVGCLPRLDRWLIAHDQPDGIAGWQHTLCANILNSMQEKFTKANYKVVKSYQDLFMEEQIVCASYGFKREFLHPQLLKEIISWQKPSGCFGNTENNEKPIANSEDDVPSQNRRNNHPAKQKKVNVAKQRYDQMKRDNRKTPHQLNIARLTQLKATHSPYAVLHIAQPPKLSSKVNYTDSGAVLLNKKHLSVVNDRLHRVAKQPPVKSDDQHRIAELKRAEAVLNRIEHNRNIDDNQPKQKIKQANDRTDDSMRRKLLSMKHLSDGCEVHATAVAAGVLGIYLHYFLEDPADIVRELSIKSNGKTNPLRGDENKEDEANDEDDSPDQANENDYIDSNVARNQAAHTLNKIKPQKKLVIGPNSMKHQPADDAADDDYDRYDYEKEDSNNKDANDDSYNSKNENKDIHLEENHQPRHRKDSSKTSSRIDNHFSSSLPYTHLLFFAIIMFVMIFIMYRFIKRRRVSIRYKSFPRT